MTPLKPSGQAMHALLHPLVIAAAMSAAALVAVPLAAYPDVAILLCLALGWNAGYALSGSV